jgi:hexosaminidase
MLLLPQPQTVEQTGGSFMLPASGWIALDVPCPADLLFTAQQAQAALRDHVELQIAGGSVPALVTLSLAASRPQGYRLDITPDGVHIAGHDLPGVFYGVMTLLQLVQTYGRELPLLAITDWPDFATRGVLLDISRDKVPSMETLYALVDMLAGWKLNQFQLYTEHTFAYRNHHVVWAEASPMTAEQILALDAYCRQRHIELVPNQNSFGHLARWFKHARYLPLAETTGPVETSWGMMPPFSLSPAAPGALDFLRELYDELLPNFTSRQFNVGCDETIDLGLGRSAALVREKGKGRVYLDFLLEIYRLVQARGHTMQFWGDIINQYPDLVPEIPKDTIALEWGYEADHDFPGKTRLFADAGVPYYVCSGTSSWTTIAGRTDNCIGNIRNAVDNGHQHGAIGVLNTDWGDRGHWQPLPVSYLGFAYGAALSWNTARDINLPAALDAFAFRDRAQVMGRLAYDLGNAYQQPGVLVTNASLLFWLYHTPLDAMRTGHFSAGLDGGSRAVLHDDERLARNLHATLGYIDDVLAPLDRADMQRPDGDLVRREMALAGAMLRHGAQRGLFQLHDTAVTPAELQAGLEAIEREFQAVWLARNRPGGLDDSVARLRQAKDLDH